MNNNLKIFIFFIGFTSIQICTTFEADNGHLKTVKRSCITCDRKQSLFSQDIQGFSQRKQLFFLYNYFYDIHTQKFIYIHQKCWKPNHKFILTKKYQTKIRSEDVKYQQKGTLLQWFTQVADKLSYLLTNGNSVCVECSRKKQLVSSSISTNLDRFNILMFGSIINNNVQERVCIKPSNVYSKKTFDRKIDTNDSYFIHLPIQFFNQTITLFTKNVSDETYNLTVTSKLSYTQWYYKLLQVFKLKCLVKLPVIPKIEPVKLTTIVPSISKLSYEQWFYNFIRNFKLICFPSRVKLDHDQDYMHWRQRFLYALKLTSSNLALKKYKRIGETWWTQFMLRLKLFSNNTNFKHDVTKADGYKYLWHHRFVRLFKLQTPSNVTIRRPYTRLLNSFRLFCHNPDFKPKLTVFDIAENITETVKSDDYKYLWYKRFIGLFKIQTWYNVTMNTQNIDELTPSVDMDVDDAVNRSIDIITFWPSSRLLNSFRLVSRNPDSKIILTLIDINDNITVTATPNENVSLVTPFDNVTVIVDQDSHVNITKKHQLDRSKMFIFAKTKLALYLSRNLGGEIDDAVLFFLCISYLMIWMMLSTMSYNSHNKSSAIKQPVSQVQPQPQPQSQPSIKQKKSTKLLPIPAAVIAARKKIELELVVAIVDIAPYPSYSTKIV